MFNSKISIFKKNKENSENDEPSDGILTIKNDKPAVTSFNKKYVCGFGLILIVIFAVSAMYGSETATKSKKDNTEIKSSGAKGNHLQDIPADYKNNGTKKEPVHKKDEEVKKIESVPRSVPRDYSDYKPVPNNIKPTHIQSIPKNNELSEEEKIRLRKLEEREKALNSPIKFELNLSERK